MPIKIYLPLFKNAAFHFRDYQPFVSFLKGFNAILGAFLGLILDYRY